MMTQRITFNLALAFSLISVAAVLAYCHRIGLIGADLPARGTMIASGILVAFYGNAIPKLVTTTSPSARAVQRVAGWAITLAGLAYAAIWAFAPIDRAANASMATLGTGLAVIAGYCLWRRSKPE